MNESNFTLKFMLLILLQVIALNAILICTVKVPNNADIVLELIMETLPLWCTFLLFFVNIRYYVSIQELIKIFIKNAT